MRKDQLHSALEVAEAISRMYKIENIELRELLFEREKEIAELYHLLNDHQVTVTVKSEWRVEELEKQLLDEKEVWIRARRIYKALQNTVSESLSLEEKAKNLYLFTIWKQENRGTIHDAIKDWEATLDCNKELWMQYFIEISSGKMLEDLSY